MEMFLAHMTHSAESCYLFNDKRRAELKGLASNKEEMAKKHEVTVITAYFSAQSLVNIGEVILKFI